MRTETHQNSRADELAAPNKIKDGGGGIPGGKANKDPVTELFGLLTHMLVKRILGGVAGGQSIDLVPIKFVASNAAAFAAVRPRCDDTPGTPEMLKNSDILCRTQPSSSSSSFRLSKDRECGGVVAHVTFSVQ